MEDRLEVLSERRGIPLDILKDYHVLSFKDEDELEDFINLNPKYKGLREFKDDKMFYKGYVVVNFIDKKESQIIMVIYYLNNDHMKYFIRISDKLKGYFKNSKVLGLSRLDHNKDYVVFVEGVFDYISLSSLGVNTIAVMGTHISDYHQLIAGRFKRVYLALDKDAMGSKSVESNLKKLDNSVSVEFPYVEGKDFKDIDEVIRYFRSVDKLDEVKSLFR